MTSGARAGLATDAEGRRAARELARPRQLATGYGPDGAADRYGEESRHERRKDIEDPGLSFT